jgi:elongation factor Ts
MPNQGISGMNGTSNNVSSNVKVADRDNSEKKLPDKSKLNTSMTAKTEISVETIKELRDQTGISIMQCKKALEEAGGDVAKALIILRNKSGELAAKKNDRIFHSGTVQAYIHSNGSVGSMVELLCESDFVSNTDEFKALARDIAMHVTATNPKFLSQADITEEDKKAAMSVFEKEVAGKPEAIKAKILEGKLASYFGEMVLMDQPFIKNPELTVQGLVNNAVQKFGEKMAVGKFKRFKVLEG